MHENIPRRLPLYILQQIPIVLEDEAANNADEVNIHDPLNNDAIIPVENIEDIEEDLEPTYNDLINLFYNHAIPHQLPPLVNWDHEDIFGFGEDNLELLKLALYARRHYIQLTFDGLSGICALCDKVITGNLHVFKEHTETATHSSYNYLRNKISLELWNTLDGFKTVISLKIYLSSLIYLSGMEYFVINGERCVCRFSLVFIGLNKDRRKYECLVCKNSVINGTVKDHIRTDEHKNHFFNAGIYVAPWLEFIRDIGHNRFHCGYCNEVVHGQAFMKFHVREECHFMNKTMELFMADMANESYTDLFRVVDIENLTMDEIWNQITEYY